VTGGQRRAEGRVDGTAGGQAALDEDVLVLSYGESYTGVSLSVYGADGSFCGVRFDFEKRYRA
jgi:hypothetical protein